MFWNRTGKSEQSEQAAQIAELGAFEQAIQSRVPYIEFTPEGVVTFVNDRFLAIVGYAREEVIGKHHSALCFPEDVKTREYEQLWQDLRRGESRNAPFHPAGQIGQGGLARGQLLSDPPRWQGDQGSQGGLQRHRAAIHPGTQPGSAGGTGQIPGRHRLPARWHRHHRQPEFPALLRLPAGRGGGPVPPHVL
ncbi:PAS domain S-box protein [Aeromonas hydrophila]|uniref:PAS domain S-box protein n=1 Tax=Aeromonas hydrophila TaxID=644 RepID=UPI003977AA7C